MQGCCGVPAFESAPFHRRGDAHGLAVLGNRASGDVHAVRGKQRNDAVVRENVGLGFAFDHLTDAVPHRFGGMRFGAVYRMDGGGEEVFQFEQAARRGDILFEVTRLTVDSCIPMASAMVRRLSGLK